MMSLVLMNVAQGLVHVSGPHMLPWSGLEREKGRETESTVLLLNRVCEGSTKTNFFLCALASTCS